MFDQSFINEFKKWLNLPDDNDVDFDYEPPSPDEIGLKPGAPDSSIKAYKEFKILYREAELKGERL